MDMKRAFFISLILILSFAFAQETPPAQSKNVICITGGIFFVYYTVQLNYERVIWEPDIPLLKSISIKGGAGWWETWVSKGTNYALTFSAMSGKQDWHLL